MTPTWSNHWLRHPQGASLGSAPTMYKPRLTWSHSFPVPVSRSLQVSLLASQPTESAAGGEPCGEPPISHDSHHVSLVQWTTCLLPVTRDSSSNPLGGLLWNRDSPVSDVSLQSEGLSGFPHTQWPAGAWDHPHSHTSPPSPLPPLHSTPPSPKFELTKWLYRFKTQNLLAMKRYNYFYYYFLGEWVDSQI